MAAHMRGFRTCFAFKTTSSLLNFSYGKCQFHVSSSVLLRGKRGVQPEIDESSTAKEVSSPYFSEYSRRRSTRGVGRGSLTDSTPLVSGASSSAHRSTESQPSQRRAHRERANVEGDPSPKSPLEDLPRYDKADASDKRLGRAMMLSRSRKYREQKGKVVLEGRRLVADALHAGAKADTIFFSQVSNIQGLPLGQRSKVNLVKVAFKDIKLWSELSTPQGIVGVFRQPKYDNLNLASGAEQRLPLTLVCDNIRDPGNLGTILRSAAAAACHKVLLSKGCVDAWDPKVLRSGAGAHFRIPIIPNVTWPSLSNYLEQHSTVHIADCNSASSNPETILHLQTDEEDILSTEQSESNVNSAVGALTVSEAYTADDDIREEPTLRTVPYFGLNWVTGPCALVVGGETEGVSEEAAQLCVETGGQRVHIPMSLGVDSLNAAMATGIILFEAKRQFLISR